MIYLDFDEHDIVKTKRILHSESHSYHSAAVIKSCDHDLMG